MLSANDWIEILLGSAWTVTVHLKSGVSVQ